MPEEQDAIAHQLEACQETVRELEEENKELRYASGAFGQLAERLNTALREERRRADDRRSVRRYYGDRRRQPAARDVR